MRQQESMRDRYSADRANKPSALLSPDENDQLYSLLGRKCQTMCTAVAQVYQTEGTSHSIWKKKHTGALCFVRDSAKRSYFLRMYCLLKNDLVWEHEIYDQMNMTKSRPYLLTFEGQDGYVGLNFASETECDSYYKVTVTTEERSRKRQERRARSRGQTTAVANNVQGPGVEEPGKVTLRNHPQLSSVSLTPNTNMSPIKPVAGNIDKKSKRRGRKFSKSDISKPTNFVHVSHVGWNAQKGFDMVGSEDDEMLKNFFTKAGVSEQELKDRATRDFIYDFVKHHDVLASVKSERVEKTRAPAPPPVPTRHPTQQQNGSQRSAPPPPPVRQPPPPLPTTTPPTRGPPPSRPPPISANNSSIVPPPPPPPPPPVPQLTVVPPPPAMPQKLLVDNDVTTPSSIMANDPRSALMESIRKGTTLKKIDHSSLSTGSGDSRSDLMTEIRQGIELRPVETRELASASNRSSENRGTDALADALRRALQDRGRAIHSSDDDSDESTDNDGEWED